MSVGGSPSRSSQLSLPLKPSAGVDGCDGEIASRGYPQSAVERSTRLPD